MRGRVSCVPPRESTTASRSVMSPRGRGAAARGTRCRRASRRRSPRGRARPIPRNASAAERHIRRDAHAGPEIGRGCAGHGPPHHGGRADHDDAAGAGDVDRQAGRMRLPLRLATLRPGNRHAGGPWMKPRSTTARVAPDGSRPASAGICATRTACPHVVESCSRLSSMAVPTCRDNEIVEWRLPSPVAWTGYAISRR